MEMSICLMAERLPPSFCPCLPHIKKRRNAAFCQTQRSVQWEMGLFFVPFCFLLILTSSHSHHSLPASSTAARAAASLDIYGQEQTSCAHTNRNICANFSMRLWGFGIHKCLQTLCRDSKGAIIWTPPFYPHTAWLLFAKPDGWEGSRFHLANISKCGKVLKIAPTWNATFCGCKPASAPFQFQHQSLPV